MEVVLSPLPLRAWAVGFQRAAVAWVAVVVVSGD